MSKINQNLILEKSAEIFARGGMGEFSIRHLSDSLGVVPSVIYHYFKDEKSLLKSMFDYTNIQLGFLRSNLPKTKTASEMLKQRIGFQIDYADKVVAVLKYYLAFRNTFKKYNQGFVPDKSSLHIEEVLERGFESKEFNVDNLKDEAKVITHAINGFLLEYYPYKLVGREKAMLITRIYNFLIKALVKEEKIC